MVPSDGAPNEPLNHDWTLRRKPIAQLVLEAGNHSEYIEPLRAEMLREELKTLNNMKYTNGHTTCCNAI